MKSKNIFEKKNSHTNHPHSAKVHIYTVNHQKAKTPGYHYRETRFSHRVCLIYTRLSI